MKMKKFGKMNSIFEFSILKLEKIEKIEKKIFSLEISTWEGHTRTEVSKVLIAPKIQYSLSLYFHLTKISLRGRYKPFSLNKAFWNYNIFQKHLLLVPYTEFPISSSNFTSNLKTTRNLEIVIKIIDSGE